jgi:hypothetical protein
MNIRAFSNNMLQMALQWETHCFLIPHGHLHLSVSTNNTSNNNLHTLHIITNQNMSSLTKMKQTTRIQALKTHKTFTKKKCISIHKNTEE